jgi:SAM-dependent methyltransferase
VSYRPAVGGWPWACGLSLYELVSLGRHRWWWNLHWTVWREFRGLDIPATVQRHGGENPGELAYGETPTVTLTRILELANLPAGSRVVDLGAGRGLTVLACGLLGYQASGIELLPEYVERSRRAALRLAVGVDFLQGDMLELSWPAGELYLLNSTAFPKTFRDKLLRRLGGIKRKALIATYDWELPAETFERMVSLRLPVTWGTVLCSVHKLA